MFEDGGAVAPPHSREAEMSVLGAIMLDADALGTAAPLVQPDDFYQDAHKMIFETIIGLDSQSITPDLVTLCDALERSEQLDRVGGKAYIVELLEILPSAANAEHYAKIVREKSVRRQLLRAADSIRSEALTSADTAPEVLDRAEQAVFDIGEKEGAQGTVVVGQVLESTFSQIEQRFEQRGALTGLDTGFFRLNDYTAGLQRGELVVIAGRPSMGKTTLALNIVLNAAVAEDARCLFMSLEMSAEQVAQNMLCALSGVDGNVVRKGNLTDRDWVKLNDGAGQLHERKIYIDASPGLTPMAIRTKARRVAKRLQGIDIIVIDYLQMVASPPKSENRQQEISLISRNMKELARELECPVVALSQLNRSVDSREDHRPRMSDLRESGAIEQDADVICFLFRESYYKQEEPDEAEPGKPSELIIAKQRNGPTGTIPLTFFPHRLKFENAVGGGEG
ncbi:MAG: replicative DNA helicase [Planctomycetes bacterium]|nr:replicative DNA helicase [Planctomycetota bacterium]